MEHKHPSARRVVGAIGIAALSTIHSWSKPADAAQPAALGGGLNEIVSSYEHRSPMLAAQLRHHVSNENGDPLVRLRLAPGFTAAAVTPRLAALGFRLQTVSSINPSLIEGYLPLASARAASRLPGIATLHATQKPMAMFGTVPHQAAVLEKADLVQAAGIDGSGINVGVLSISYDTCAGCSTTAAQDIASGDLPAAGVTVLEDLPDGTDEGRAMLQLVYDIAPGASLGFATAGLGQLNFSENILALRNQFKADILVDDVYYFGEPFYSDGIIAQAVDIVTQTGAAYFSAAGNNGLEAYESVYSAVPYATAAALGAAGRSNLRLDQIPAALRPASFHNFKNADGSISITQLITSTDSQGNNIEFQWDEPFDLGLVKTDYNIYVFDKNGNWINPATSFYVFYTTDDNLLTDEPNEYLYLSPNPANSVGGTDATDYQLVIGKMNDGPAQRIKYIVLNSLAPSQRQNAPSIYGHAAASGGQAVAAAYYAIPKFPEDFSAQGPATILFDTAGNRLPQPEVRSVPQLTAADGVDTTFFGGGDPDGDGFPNFFGTSAAAPDAAAVAALVLQAAGGSGSLSPRAIYKTLQQGAAPIWVSDERWLGTAQAGPVSLTFNGDWTRWDRDFTVSVAKDSNSSVASLSLSTKSNGLIWSTNPDRFSISDPVGITEADITRVPDGALYTLSFAPHTFTPGGSFSFGMSVFSPLQNNTREDPDRFRGATLEVNLADGRNFTSTVRTGKLIGNGPFTGHGLVNAYQAVFPAK